VLTGRNLRKTAITSQHGWSLDGGSNLCHQKKRSVNMVHRCENYEWEVKVKQQENFYLKTNTKYESNLAINMTIEDNIP
jgi:hypothetical protein